MYDGPTDEFLVRETGIMVAVPELWGHIFVGRTKEGFSLNKVMVGYSGWTMERSTISDATIPILADGIKWLGYLPKQGILWNLGIYTDWLSEGQGFSTYDMQVVGRLAWLPIASEKTGTLLHLGVSGRYGKPNEGELKLGPARGVPGRLLRRHRHLRLRGDEDAGVRRRITVRDRFWWGPSTSSSGPRRRRPATPSSTAAMWS